MSELAQKCEHKDILGKQKYNIKLFIAFKMSNSCCFSLGENLDFLQRKFNNIDDIRIEDFKRMFGERWRPQSM